MKIYKTTIQMCEIDSKEKTMEVMQKVEVNLTTRQLHDNFVRKLTVFLKTFNDTEGSED